MNRLSPVISRLPAPSSAPMTPERPPLLPSPNTVSMSIPGVMYIIEPASATALSPGSSSTSTNCISLPRTRKSISWALRPGTIGGGAAAAAQIRRQLGHVLERRPVLQSCREHQCVAVNGPVPQVRNHIVLGNRSDLMAADGHVPLLLRHLGFAPIDELTN